jgi:hypothetical protein
MVSLQALPDEHADKWGALLEAQVRIYRAIADYGSALDAAVDCTPGLTAEKIDEWSRGLRRRVDGAFAVPAIRAEEARQRRGRLRLIVGGRP